MSMKGVAVMGRKGGIGKSGCSHLLALGAAWNDVDARLFHTDKRSPIQVIGRPYYYQDARTPDKLSNLIDSVMDKKGLIVIDGGGNRPEFDNWIAAAVDLVIIPVTPDQESVELAIEDRERMINAGAESCLFVLNKVSSNAWSRKFDEENFYSQLNPKLILGKVPSVSAIKTLGISDKESFKTPPTNLNNAARAFYRLVASGLAVPSSVDLELA